jgi:hypothetical protein
MMTGINKRLQLYMLMLIVFMGMTSCIQAQKLPIQKHNDVTDTLYFFTCSGEKYKLGYPKNNINKIDDYNYAEGYFVTISYWDTSYFQIHCGGNVQRPLLKSNKFVVQDSTSQTGFYERSGYVKGTNLLWREDFYPRLRLTLTFVNASKNKKELYENTLDTFKDNLSKN